MHPALSVIFFTVISGAGYGLFMLIAVAGLFEGLLSPPLAVSSVLIGLVTVSVGLASSTFHLANPKNAWRAFFRFRTSWLSREGVFAVLFYLPALLYGFVWLNEINVHSAWWFVILSLVVFAGALLTVFSTGMIYACLKTIRQWNTPMTPVNYIFISLMHGAILFLCLYWLTTPEPTAVKGLALTALAATLAAMLLKIIYYAWIGRPAGPSINTATGFNRATVRLLDVGHSGDNFLTQEFSFVISPCRIMALRSLSMGLSFIIPIVMIAMMLGGYWQTGAISLGFVSSLLGILIERWLFFAEARHVVNLYHGAQRT